MVFSCHAQCKDNKKKSKLGFIKSKKCVLMYTVKEVKRQPTEYIFIS